MQTWQSSIRQKPGFAILFFFLAAVALPVNAGEAVLISFNGTGDGRHPEFPLILDAAGNLYGTTTIRGVNGAGTAFELSADGHGGWTETILYSFGAGGKDAKTPSSGFILDSYGNLYGTTSAGGAYGQGTVYELSPNGSGGWTESVLHSFKPDGKDGTHPLGELAQDANGSIYGVTTYGGTTASGTVYELKHNSTGWVERILHRFIGNGSDGESPGGGVLFDAAGNLIGVTELGGTHGLGTAYEMRPQADGGWIERVLYSFSGGSDGSFPYGKLTMDPAGNLFGTTAVGGVHSMGTIFQMKSHGIVWSERVLYSFGDKNNDGNNPDGSLVLDSVGNLYGTTNLGGRSGRGTLYELKPHANGNWTELILHEFVVGNGDGFGPNPLIIDAMGNLFGTTLEGGTSNNGTVFEFTP